MPQSDGALRAYDERRRRQAGPEVDRRLRAGRSLFGCLYLRLFPQIRSIKTSRGASYQALPGRALLLLLDEAIDVEDLLRDTARFWQLWRAGRRRTESSKANVLKAWELLERASRDLKG